MKFKDFKPPRIVKGPKRWYIEYYTRIPPELKAKYNNQEWHRVKVFRDINRYKGAEQEEYAFYLLEVVRKGLYDGTENVLDIVKETVQQEVKKADPKQISLSTAMEKFIQHSRDKGLRGSTLQSYGIIKNYMQEYFLKLNNRLYDPLASFTRADMKAFLADARINNNSKKKWSNYTFNNYVGFAKAMFNWFVKEEYIEKSPFAGIENLPVNITSHRYYDHATAEKLKNLMMAQDPYMFKFCQFIYYTGLRPKSEARLLKVENILLDRNLIFIPASVSKNKKDDYIYLDATLKEMLLPWLSAPGHYYLFSTANQPDKKPASPNLFAWRYKKFKDALELSEDYTIYSFKHTRAIHLAEAGADPYEIMKLFRHQSLEMTMKYLRGLGVGMSEEVANKSKKF